MIKKILIVSITVCGGIWLYKSNSNNSKSSKVHDEIIYHASQKIINANTPKRIINILDKKLKIKNSTKETFEKLVDYSLSEKTISKNINLIQLIQIKENILSCISDKRCLREGFEDEEKRYFDLNDTPPHKTLHRIIKIVLNFNQDKISNIFTHNEITEIYNIDNPNIQKDLLKLILKHNDKNSIINDLLATKLKGEGFSILIKQTYDSDKEMFDNIYNQVVNKYKNMSPFAQEEFLITISKLKFNKEQVINTVKNVCNVYKSNKKVIIKKSLERFMKINNMNTTLFCSD